jgi:hypothetical protein
MAANGHNNLIDHRASIESFCLSNDQGQVSQDRHRLCGGVLMDRIAGGRVSRRI